nr:ABC transporter ATP-binding protein [candidate division Zixibacteria bacterium]
MTLDTKKVKRLWDYLRPYWHLELLTFLVMAVLATLALALPVAVKYLIDDLIPGLIAGADNGIRIKPVVYFGLVLGGIYFAQIIFSWARDYLAGYIGANIIADLRSQLFGHLERLSLKFHQSHQVGEIMSRTISDVNRIQSLLTSTLLIFLTNIFMLTAIMVYLLSTNWILTLVAIIPLPLTILLANKFGIRLHRISKKLQETIASFSARLQESLVSIKTIKAFGQESAEQKKMDKILSGLTALYVKNSVTISLSANLVNFVNMIGPIVVLSWGTYLIAGGTMKLGTLMAFYMLLSYLYTPVQSLASLHIEIKSAMASVDRLFEYLDIPPAVIEHNNPIILQKSRGAIGIDSIRFHYQDNGFGLEHFSLKIAAREKIAVVGPSGSGKTTLVNLIARFYDPDAGTISLDGIDMRRISLESLRRNITLVDQEPLLFKTTIFNNIAYSNPDRNPDEVKKAAIVANIHDFIMSLPDGYETEVGERGVTISGGEKQRICLARAILPDPAILILDEATSALDSRSEELIQEALQNILKDKTAIIIAHRLSTIQHADRIIVIDRGRIIDQGSHEELLEKSPLYRELAKRQLKI